MVRFGRGVGVGGKGGATQLSRDAKFTGPEELSVTLFFIIFIIALIVFPVGQIECPKPMHLVINPLSIVSLLINPGVDSLTVQIIVQEFSFIDRSIRPDELSSAYFLTIHILAFVFRVIIPFLHP